MQAKVTSASQFTSLLSAECNRDIGKENRPVYAFLLNNAPGAQSDDEILDDILKVFVSFVAIVILRINCFNVWATTIGRTCLVKFRSDFPCETEYILASDILIAYVYVLVETIQIEANWVLVAKGERDIRFEVNSISGEDLIDHAPSFLLGHHIRGHGWWPSQSYRWQLRFTRGY